MSITDLIPWKRKKKTKIPVDVEERSPQIVRDRAHHPDEFSHWFGLAPFGAFGGQWDIFGPRMDMMENNERFKITIETPGMDKDDINVTLSGDRVLIQGKKQEEKERRGRNTYYAQSARGAFRRSIQLPCPINADEVEASLRRGVLTISLPKVEGARDHKRIPVRSR